MASERRKQVLFSIDEFVMLLAWLLSVFAILYFEAPIELLWLSIVAFVVLNLAVGIWVNKFVKPVQDKGYRQYLTIQTLFLAVWCPLLAVILSTNRLELISLWATILLLFYFGLGIISFGKMVGNKGKK